MFDDNISASQLEGDMSIPGARKNTTQIGAPDFNTLDEPIKETFVCILMTKLIAPLMTHIFIIVIIAVTRCTRRGRKILSCALSQGEV